MKVAYVSTCDIFGPTNNGGAQCSHRNLYLLKQALGEENVFICIVTKNREDLSKLTDNMTVFFSNCDNNFYSIINSLLLRLSFNRKVETSILNYIVKLGCSHVFIETSKLGKLQKRLPKEIKQIIFMQNIEKDYIKNQLSLRPEFLLLVLPTIVNESTAVKNADIIISLNSRDANQLKKYYRRNPDLVLPITFDDSFTVPGVEVCRPSSLQLLFVGSLFPPNEYGVVWFAKEVMPHINADFTVVGKDFEKIGKRLSRNNIKIIGTVDDLAPYYHCADAVVSPILFGDGMKVKTAEALMYGKPMFATNEALEGYEVEGQKNIFRCNTAQEFIETINSYAAKSPYISFDEDIRTLFLGKYHTPCYLPVLREILISSIGIGDI